MQSRVILFLGALAASTLVHSPVGLAQLPQRTNSPATTHNKVQLNGRVLIFDMAAVPDSDPKILNRVFSFDAGFTDTLLKSVKASLERCVVGCDADAVVADIRSHADELAELSSTRWISGKGDTMDIFVFGPPDRLPKIAFKEDARQSRLEIDVGTLIQVAGKIVDKGTADFPSATVSVTHRQYYLTKSRATLKVEATLRPPQAPAAERANASAKDAPTRAKTNAKDAPQAEEEIPEKLETSFITGSEERFFLSANAAFTQARQVTYDESSKTLQPNKKPEEFLIGINYAMEDLFANDEATGVGSFLGGLYASLLVEASKTPFNQIAATVGLRRNLPFLEDFLTFATVSPYVGIVWVRNDRIQPDGASSNVKSGYSKRKFITGLSLNLDKALEWLGGDKKAASATEASEK